MICKKYFRAEDKLPIECVRADYMTVQLWLRNVSYFVRKMALQSLLFQRVAAYEEKQHEAWDFGI